MIAISKKYREADCIAILDVDVDYLPRPFSAWDLTARVRVAELRRFKAAGHKRFYRHGSFVVDLFDRTVALDGELIALAPSELNVLMHLASKPELAATFRDVLVALHSDFDWLIIARSEFWQVGGVDGESDGSGDAGLSCDEAGFFER